MLGDGWAQRLQGLVLCGLEGMAFQALKLNADGVIVGSAFVRKLIDAASPAEGVAAVGKLAAELAAGVRRTS